MRSKISLFGALVLSAVLFAAPAMAQNIVQYTGTLQMGFGDSDVTHVPPSMNGLPVCAPQVSPFTFATAPVDGYAYQDPNDGSLKFKGVANPIATAAVAGQVGANHGGAASYICNVPIPPFINPRLRSRTQVADMKFPATQGQVSTVMSSINSVGFDGVDSYTVGPGLGFNFPAGVTFTVDQPYYGGAPGSNEQQIAPGSVMYGGGIPWQGGGAVQLGINTTTLTPNGSNPLATFGIASYVGGLLPTDPTIFGTNYDNGSPLPGQGWVGANVGATMAFFTGGCGVATAPNTCGATYMTTGPFAPGTPIPPNGFIKTAFGGNTNTPLAAPTSQINLISPVSFAAGFQRWTTGRVSHSDMIGDFVTDRNVTGADGAGTAGGTRHLTLVTPWSASIKLIGPFGFPIPALGFGGTGVLDLEITPVPEPGSMALIGFGVAGLVGLRSMRRRN